MEDEELIKLALENNEEAKNKIYEKYKYIVDILMKKYHNAIISLGIDKRELIQEALYAFSDAINSFNQEKKVKLSTFITVCVDRRIKKVLKMNKILSTIVKTFKVKNKIRNYLIMIG